uniref:BAHD acyltransferase n=1 Tax=Hyoscyamus niger TaxID=4079 RepID=A0AAF1C101_HYONI|nr:BAHD acyltransferase [Hyoscyamus niger]
MASAALKVLSRASKKLIKPSSPTPLTQKWHKFSLIEQAQTHTYVPFGFFYSNNQLGALSNQPTQISKLLEKSLSKNLVSYYPYAGEMKDNAVIDCNDKGVEFLNVHIDAPISQILNHKDCNVKDVIFPNGVAWENDSDYGLAVIQITHFNCGGIAISTCLSHKIGDACNGLQFSIDWATLTRDPNAELVQPYYISDTIFPSPPSGPLDSPVVPSILDGCTQKRYIFSSKNVSKLKSFVASESQVKNPTTTEVLSTLLFKCVSKAVTVNLGSFVPSKLIQYADLREMISPKLPPKSVGNVLSHFSTHISDEAEMNLPTILSLMRKEKQLFRNKDNIKENAWALEILELAKGLSPQKKEFDEYTCSSVCKFPFYDVDFGWGKPMATTIATGPYNKLFNLMNYRDDGIEAFVMLDEQDMAVFEGDEEFLEFASPYANYF